jgi:hypothetical protein
MRTQTQRLFDWLSTGRSINPLVAWETLGIYRLGARIFDLKKLGHKIINDGEDVENRFGEKCHVARYRLDVSQTSDHADYLCGSKNANA